MSSRKLKTDCDVQSKDINQNLGLVQCLNKKVMKVWRPFVFMLESRGLEAFLSHQIQRPRNKREE